MQATSSSVDSDHQVRYGQLIVGPPGSGKTTFCHGMHQYLTGLGRDIAVVNLDPANSGENLPYEAQLDIGDLISLEVNVMQELDLGPNGALVYCLEYLEQNLDWLVLGLQRLGSKYFVIDFPGQVELFTHYSCVHNIAHALQQKYDFRLTAVHLVDAHHCSDSSLFISAVLLSLTTMIRLELPHINVLSKVDLIETRGPLAFNLDFFTECHDIKQMTAYLTASPIPGDDIDPEEDDIEGTEEPVRETPAMRRFRKINESLCDVIDDYRLVSFHPLDIQDKSSMGRVVAAIDKANGFILSATVQPLNPNLGGSGYEHSVFQAAFGHVEPSFERIADIQEKYIAAFHVDESNEKGDELQS